jgi:putative phosphoribosyl transferase
MVHLPFADRVEAGRLLAKELSSRNIVSSPDSAVVLALTRGGVPVGFAVADRLRLPLDVVVVRKLGVPWQPELAMGAIANGTQILDDRTIRQLGIFADDIAEIVARELAEIDRREQLYRGGRQPVDLHGRTAIVVDDGLATGSTMLAAVRYVHRLGPARIVVAVPVGSKEALSLLRRNADIDDIICLATPHLFFAVGEWYRDFPQVGDSEVEHLLTESRQQLRKHLSALVEQASAG